MCTLSFITSSNIEWICFCHSVIVWMCHTGGELNSFFAWNVYHSKSFMYAREEENEKRKKKRTCLYVSLQFSVRNTRNVWSYIIDRHIGGGAIDAKRTEEEEKKSETIWSSHVYFIYSVHRSEFAQICVCMLNEYCQVWAEPMCVCVCEWMNLLVYVSVTYAKRRNAKH